MTTKDGHLIALSSGFDVSNVLSGEVQEPGAGETARKLLLADTLAACRITAAQVFVVTQLVRLVNINLRTRELFQKRVLQGKELLPTQYQERVIRLCGRESDVVKLTIERCGTHLVPVLEDFSNQQLISQITHGGTIPAFWFVSAGSYGLDHSWTGLVQSINDRFLLKTKNGKKILYMEADTTNAESALSFNSISQ